MRYVPPLPTPAHEARAGDPGSGARIKKRRLPHAFRPGLTHVAPTALCVSAAPWRLCRRTRHSPAQASSSHRNENVWPIANCYLLTGSSAGTGTFFSPFNSAAVCWMLCVEKPLKNPHVPYLSCNCGSTAFMSSWPDFPSPSLHHRDRTQRWLKGAAPAGLPEISPTRQWSRQSS